MNLKLEDALKKLQIYVLSQYKDNPIQTSETLNSNQPNQPNQQQQSQQSTTPAVETSSTILESTSIDQNTSQTGTSNELSNIDIIQEIPISDELTNENEKNNNNNNNLTNLTPEELASQSNTNIPSISPLSNLLSPDIAHDYENIDKNVLPSSLLIIFQEIYQTLDSSSDLRLNVRDSAHLAEHRHHEGISDNLQTNEEKNESSESNSMSSLFGKILQNPSTFLENLRTTTNSSTNSTTQNPNTSSGK